jgi:hypothetical protein
MRPNHYINITPKSPKGDFAAVLLCGNATDEPPLGGWGYIDSSRCIICIGAYNDNRRTSLVRHQRDPPTPPPPLPKGRGSVGRSEILMIATSDGQHKRGKAPLRGVWGVGDLGGVRQK